jgi:PKD repeat protein
MIPKKRLLCQKFYLQTIFLLFVFNYNGVLFSQNQNNWIIRTECGFSQSSKLDDTAEFAFQINFNCEPPCINEVMNKAKIHNVFATKQITLSDQKGNLSLFTTEKTGFTNGKYKTINPDIPEFTGFNSIMAFPTSNDSIVLLIYKRDSILNTLPLSYQDHGQINVYSALYHINNQKFISYNKLIDFKDSTFRQVNWIKGFKKPPFVIFNQYLDFRTGHFYLFLNIGDTVYTSRYSISDNSFTKPYFSGLTINNYPYDQKYNSVSPSGENFIINNSGNKAFFASMGIRLPYFQTLNFCANNALFQLDFNKKNGTFSNEKLIKTLNFNGHHQTLELSPSDTILYIAAVNQRDSFVKIVFNSNYTNFQYHNIALPSKALSRASDIKLGPNGKIYILFQTNGIDTLILEIKKPDDPSPSIQFGHLHNLFGNKKHQVVCDHLGFYNFPLTYGQYRNIKFKAKSACKNFDMLLHNYSDTFWFKKYTLFFGDGDSIDLNSKQKTIKHSYNKQGIYLVKLKAYDNFGAWAWYSDSITVSRAPSAYFNVPINKECLPVNIIFKDSSYAAQLKPDSMFKQWWYFGDGNTSFRQSFNKDQRIDISHAYLKPGTYKVKCIVSDGYCSDTFIKPNGIIILNAPKNGVTASDTQGCSPLKVSLSPKFNDAVDSIYYHLSNGTLIKSIPPDSISLTINTPGKHRIIQMLFGSSGCKTSDTFYLNVLQGIDKKGQAQILYVTVLQNKNIEVKWNKFNHANHYKLFKSGKLYQILNDTVYIDQQVSTSNTTYSYSIEASDICGQSTLMSEAHQSILLHAKYSAPKLAVLNWSSYYGWLGGVSNYSLFALNNSNIEFLNSSKDSSVNSFIDEDFLVDGKYEKCYLIEAFEKGMNSNSSRSNQVCLPYESIIWIPTAITVNGDGINESLQINTYGIKSFTFMIYNRWGEKIFETNNNNEVWEPNASDQGVYMYFVNAETNDGNYISKGTITVLR